MIPGLGPVFSLEWSLVARRWQTFALRSLLVAALLIALTAVWFALLGWNSDLSLEDVGRIGQPFFIALVGTQLAIVMLAAPGAAAGAICLDKTRGNLQLLMTTDLSDAEIVLGKLAARLVPVIGLVLCSMPVLAMASLLGGIDLEALIGAYLVTLGVGVLGCTLALTSSLWGRKTHEVLLLNYLVWALLLLAYPLAAYIDAEFLGGIWVSLDLAQTNPFWLAFLPYVQPGVGNVPQAAIMLGVCLVLSLVLLIVTGVSFRRVVLAQSGRSARPKPPSIWKRRDFDYLGPLAPTLDGNPVLWREWRRRKLSSWMRVVWAVYAFVAVGVSGLTAALNFIDSDDPGISAWVNGLQLPLGLLLVGVTAVTCFAEERVRGSLDVLLCTPLSTPAIFWGKWLGAFRPIPLLTLLPALVALPLMCYSGEVGRWLLVVLFALVHGAAVVSLGVAVAVWVRQQGRAIGIVASFYLIVTVAVPLTLLASGAHSDEMEGLATMSTFFGMGTLTFFVSEQGGNDEVLVWIVFWIGFHAAAALVLAAAAALTFDQCLGRVSESGMARKRQSLRP